jgi:hypothetical protein
VDCQKSTLGNRVREEESDIAGEVEAVGDNVRNSTSYGTQRFLRYLLFANMLSPPRPLQPVLKKYQLFVLIVLLLSRPGHFEIVFFFSVFKKKKYQKLSRIINNNKQTFRGGKLLARGKSKVRFLVETNWIEERQLFSISNCHGTST